MTRCVPGFRPNLRTRHGTNSAGLQSPPYSAARLRNGITCLRGIVSIAEWLGLVAYAPVKSRNEPTAAQGDDRTQLCHINRPGIDTGAGDHLQRTRRLRFGELARNQCFRQAGSARDGRGHDGGLSRAGSTWETIGTLPIIAVPGERARTVKRPPTSASLERMPGKPTPSPTPANVPCEIPTPLSVTTMWVLHLRKEM